MTTAARELESLQLLRKERPPAEPLRTLCHHGYLVGGLSIALDVKIDEALGPLLELIGGAARTMRVLDIQGRVFSVKVGAVEHEWELDSVEALIDTLNRTFAKAPEVKALALLGEWEDMLQVWALPKALLPRLRAHEWFRNSLSLPLPDRGEGRGEG